MKAVINLGNFVIDTKNLDILEKLINGAERQDYDYIDSKCIYYIKPLPSEGVTITIIPNDLAETQRLAWKLKEENK